MVNLPVSNYSPSIVQFSILEKLVTATVTSGQLYPGKSASFRRSLVFGWTAGSHI
jgi:hypothetical protein